MTGVQKERLVTLRNLGLAKLIAREWADPMSRSGIFLLANTAVTGTLGIVYWIIAARLYSQTAVGRGGALISAATLLAGVGQMNLSGMLARFIPIAPGRSRQLVLLAYGAACGAALILTIVAGVGVELLTPPSSPLRMAPALAAVFTASVLAGVVSTLQDSVLISVRRTAYVPLENGGFGIAKIVLLVALASVSASTTVFASWVIPLALTVPIINWLLFRRLLPQRTGPRSIGSVPIATRRSITHFVLGDASAGMLTQTWMYLLPVLVTAALGAKVNALFYVAFLFASTLNLISINFSLPLVVEGAREPDRVISLAVGILRRIYLVLLPLVVVFLVFAPLILRLYGARYAGAVGPLRMLVLSCIPGAVVSVFGAACRVRGQTYRSAFLQGLACFGIIAGTLLFHGGGLTAIAAVVLCVQSGVAALAVLQLMDWQRRLRHGAASPVPSTEQMVAVPGGIEGAPLITAVEVVEPVSERVGERGRRRASDVAPDPTESRRQPAAAAADPPKQKISTRRRTVLKLVCVGTACGATVALQALSGYIARSTGTAPDLVFWSSLLLGYGVTLAVVASRGLSRSETALVIVLLSVAMQLTRYALYPSMFVYHDELQHVRTLENILALHKLFTPNATLPVSALYPGLETATAGLMSLTGLSLHTSGTLILVVARLVMSLAMFLVLCRLLNSTRAAGVACLIYIANPQYLFFNSQFAYQSLALALSFAYVFLLVSLSHQRTRIALMWLLPTSLAIAATHHLTSWGLAALLLTWLVVSVYTGQRPRHLICATVLIVLSVMFWTGLQAHILFPYLSEIFKQQIESGKQLLEGHVRQTQFKASTADLTPAWQQYASIACVLLLASLLVPSLWAGRRWFTRRRAAAIVLLLVAATYPLLPLGHLAGATADLSDRASGFVFVGVGFVLAAWLITTPHPLLARFGGSQRWRWLIPTAFVVGGLVCFIGNSLTASGPPDFRTPGRYIVGGENRAVDPVALAAAHWEGHHLAPYGRTFSDRTNGLLAATDGNQHAISAAADGVSTFQISRLLLAPPSSGDLSIVRQDHVQYLVVDTRIATDLPDVGEYVETGEFGQIGRTRPPSWSAVTKFNFVAGVSRVYDNGSIRIYDLRGIR